MLILSRPVAGRDVQFNEWYQAVHLPQMLALKGFTSAQRFRLAKSMGQREAPPYAAIYEIETEDLDGVLQDLYREALEGRLLIDEALDRPSVFAAVYEELGPKRQNPAAE